MKPPIEDPDLRSGYPRNWERVNPGGHPPVVRLLVPGGWLVCVESPGVDTGAVFAPERHAVCFVPDEGTLTNLGSAVDASVRRWRLREPGEDLTPAQVAALDEEP